MAARKSTTRNPGDAIADVQFDIATLTCHIVGRTPLLFNRMVEKAKRDALFPSGRKTEAERAQSLKHNPVAEFRNSIYRNKHDDAPTRLRFPAPAFKGVIKTAALDMPGAKKAQIGRLAWVGGTYVDVYGIPMLKMDVVRQAGISKAPDIRTRACIEHWCCQVSFEIMTPALTPKAIANLMAQGGYVVGIGDGRQEKGTLNYGQFAICNENDPRYLAIMQAGGREAQDEALEQAEPFDEETRELLVWYSEEIDRRGRRKQLAEMVGVDVDDDDYDDDENVDSES